MRLDPKHPAYVILFASLTAAIFTAAIIALQVATAPVVARTEKLLKPGEVAGLSKADEKHWMRSGPEGAIVTEYATYHDGKGLRFSHPKVTM